MKFYVCPICKNVVELVVDHHVPVVCCGTKMNLLDPNTENAAVEKHMPVATIENDVLTVSVGEVTHPMLEKHSIKFISVKAGNNVLRYNLTPEENPSAKFNLNGYKGLVQVYAYCDLHGLWKVDVAA